MDIDRLYNIPLNEIINRKEIRCVLPMYYDIDFSQDIMISCSKNPIYKRAIELNLERRRMGCRDILSLGPITFFHAVTETLMGRQLNRYPDEKTLRELRDTITRCKYLITYREEPPYNTLVYRGPAIPIDKEEFYKSETVTHWVTTCGNTVTNKPFGS